jgi:hypothetical protein
MAIPVYLQQFKAAGVYRVVFDKSTVQGVDSEILRLVVGYSEKGPFNIPTYVTSVSDFKAIYGDISKKLEKRGIFFHRLAMQALSAGPILALNLKKFDGETVDGATINTNFNPSFEPIDTVKINVEDIYDTSRFWELSAEKLNNLRSVSGSVMDQYINICATNTKDCSGTYIIRKAAGQKVSGYNLTISDWYSDGSVELPEYLEPYKNSLVSDFFAEIYVFKGRFIASQVLASSTLKNYFEVETDPISGKPKTDDEGNVMVKLRPYVINAYGEHIDTLDALYQDETANALGHYVGCLIPSFKNKQGQYVSLDILFNTDQDVHNMMMSFNTDALEEEGTANIDLSGRLSIKESMIHDIFFGTQTTTLLGNTDSVIVSDTMEYINSAVEYDGDKLVAAIPFNQTNRKVSGTLFVRSIDDKEDAESYVVGSTGSSVDDFAVTLMQIGKDDAATKAEEVKIAFKNRIDLYDALVKLHAAYIVDSEDDADYTYEDPVTKVKTSFKQYVPGFGTVWNDDEPFIVDGKFEFAGPQQIITSVSRIEAVAANINPDHAYTDADNNLRVNIEDIAIQTIARYPSSVAVEGDDTDTTAVYGSSVSFIPVNNAWKEATIAGSFALVSEDISDSSLYSVLSVGDCFLADDASTDRDGDGYIDDKDGFLDNVYVQETYTENDEHGLITRYVVKLTGKPKIVSPESSADYLVRIDAALNQEIGTIIPQYLTGYVYKNDKPAGTGMKAKLDWQDFILSTLTDYKGIRTALLNKSDIDYRYIVDTFDSYVDADCKNVLSFLAKEKQSAFAILNFPAIKTFIKCPYTSFTDAKGVFNVDYIVKGYNKKKAAGVRFSLPTDNDGASFCAFYTPLKFSDGYVDTIVPAAGLVSNLFIKKYSSRQPYYIIAGPNYGNITASGLVGPDYTFSQDELQIIEPYGVNCMIYRPGFGTFINANQTAKQTPVSALSKVNVRELVIYLQDEIEKVLQAYQWEFNNQTTRNAILDKANMICSRVASNGGIQAYLNVMDESNNTPEIIDNEMAVLSTHIEPGMGCGKMVQELTLYRTGQMSANISD